MNKHRTSRREFLALTAALATSACSNGRQDGKTTMHDDLTELGAAEAVAAMKNGEISAEAYAGALLSRCQERQHLNAFISFEPQRVLEAARTADLSRAAGRTPGLLHGLPVPVKDSVNTKDYPTSGGSRALARFQPAEDAELVRRLRDAGAIVLGKTNIHELSFGWTSNNRAFGAVRNPYNIERIPGGSSGGTAAAVAARMAPLGIAEDTQGSIRVPAALCGIYGFRPTQNRYPNQGVVPITPLFDQVGPHARNVADIALFDHVISGDPLVDSAAVLQRVRLGVAKQYYFESLDTEVARITDQALRQLAGAGVELVDVDVPNLSELISLTTAQVQSYHVKPMLEKYLQEFGTGISFEELMMQTSDDVKAAFELFVLGGALTPTEAEFVAARDVHLPALRRTMQDYFDSNNLDAMIFPATQVAATPIGQDTEILLNGETVPFEPVISRNISPGSTAGLPGLVVPVALNSEGLPVSLELDGPARNDRRILAIGLAIEELLGHLPPPSA